MKYTVQEVNNYFFVLDSFGKTVKVYLDKIAAYTMCNLLNRRAAA